MRVLLHGPANFTSCGAVQGPLLCPCPDQGVEVTNASSYLRKSPSKRPPHKKPTIVREKSSFHGIKPAWIVIGWGYAPGLGVSSPLWGLRQRYGTRLLRNMIDYGKQKLSVNSPFSQKGQTWLSTWAPYLAPGTCAWWCSAHRRPPVNTGWMTQAVSLQNTSFQSPTQCRLLCLLPEGMPRHCCLPSLTSGWLGTLVSSQWPLEAPAAVLLGKILELRTECQSGQVVDITKSNPL